MTKQAFNKITEGLNEAIIFEKLKNSLKRRAGVYLSDEQALKIVKDLITEQEFSVNTTSGNPLEFSIGENNTLLVELLTDHEHIHFGIGYFGIEKLIQGLKNIKYIMDNTKPITKQ